MEGWRRCGKAVIAIGLIHALVLVAFGGLALYAASERTEFVNRKVALDNRLHIPPILKPESLESENVYRLSLRSDVRRLLPVGTTETWGVNGAYLGPTIRVRTGDKVAMRVTNRLAEATTLHWHGMELPAAMDGGPHQAIGAGEAWQPFWTVTNQAATLWYHPHLMGRTAEHIYRGLAGLIIVDDENADRLNIPKTYGVDDIPVIVQDRSFGASGDLRYEPSADGLFGDTILVNGTYAPFVTVPAGWVRLRLLNASNSRRYNFGFGGNKAFQQIASDGGFLEAPVLQRRLLLAPGERAEIIVDMEGGAKATLMSYAVDDDDNIFVNFGKLYLGVTGDENQMFKILELRAGAGPARLRPLPSSLNTVARWHARDAVKTRRFVLNDDHTINAKKMRIDRIDEIVRAGDVEIWQIESSSIRSHPFHIHGVQFQLLDRDGTLPAPHERGWKDTVMVRRAETVRLIMRFATYPDADAAYMYHCHMLEHEDGGMMGQFVVADDSAIETGARSSSAERSTHPRH